MSFPVSSDGVVAWSEPRPVRPIVVGVVGDSGSGRSTLVHQVQSVLSDIDSAVLRLDDYHTLARSDRRERGVTALSPSANDLARAAADLAALRRGESIEKPVYQHETGTLGAPERLAPAAVLLVSGLLGFATAELSALFDVRVFLDPDAELRSQWKRSRDTRERGYDDAGVRTELEARRSDREEFVQPQREAADVVISLFPQAGYWSTRDDAHLNVRVAVRRADLAATVETVARAAPQSVGRPLLRLADGDEPGDLVTLIVDGELPQASLEALAAGLGARTVPTGTVALTAAALVVAQLVRRDHASAAG